MCQSPGWRKFGCCCVAENARLERELHFRLRANDNLQKANAANREGYFLSFPFRSPGGTYQVIGIIAVSRSIRLVRHVIRSWDHRLLVTYCALQRQCRLSLTRIKQLGEYPWLFFLKERGSISINSIKITEKLNLEIFATFWSVVVWPLRMCSDKS